MTYLKTAHLKYSVFFIVFVLLFLTVNAETYTIFPKESALIRTGESVSFKTEYTAKSYKWEFEGGTPRVSYKKNPLVTYNSIGEFSVKLTVKNNKKESIIIQNRAVTVVRLNSKYNKVHHIQLNNKQDIWIKGEQLKVKPGDLIVIRGEGTGITFNNINGTKENPVRIINYGLVKINYTGHRGIGLNNCKHIIIDGKNDKNFKYGFLINVVGKSQGSAIDINKLSSDIEIFGVEIATSGFAGIMAKTNPNPKNPDTWRYRYTLNHLKIHHNYIHDTRGEGMYIGFNTYAPQKGNFKAHSVKNAKIWGNIITDTGWDGIQLGCADFKTEIHNNIITNCGKENKFGQNSGMSLNTGFNGDVYNNTIINGPGNAINIMPLDSVRIYGNIIQNVNKSNYGIYLQNNSMTNYNCAVYIFNNFIHAGTGLIIHNKSNSTKIEKLYFENNIISFNKSDINVDFKKVIDLKKYSHKWTLEPNVLVAYDKNSFKKYFKADNFQHSGKLPNMQNIVVRQNYFGEYNYIYLRSKK